IGYWIRQADQALTTHIDAAQSAQGLARLDWQLLNLLHDRGAQPGQAIAHVMQPFADTHRLGEALAALAARGVIEGDGSEASPFRLTEEGRRLHASAAAVQQEVRQKAVQGISQDDYVTAVRVLQRIVENLGSS